MMQINPSEIECLERLERYQSLTLSPCDSAILHHLLSIHLIEEVPGIKLPIEMAHNQYRLTQTGRNILKENRNNLHKP